MNWVFQYIIFALIGMSVSNMVTINRMIERLESLEKRLGVPSS